MKIIINVSLCLLVSFSYMKVFAENDVDHSNLIEILITHSPWAPFEYQENGVSKGINLEIVTATFAEMGFVAKFKQYPWKRAYEEAKIGRMDAVFSMAISDERKEYFWVPEQSMVTIRLYIYFLKGKVVPFEKDLKALEGLRIGTARGYIYPDYFTNSKRIQRREVNSNLINMKKARVGRIDGFVCEDINCELLIKENQFEGVFEPYREVPIELREMFIGFSKKSALIKDYPNLHKRFSRVLKKLKKEGVIGEIKRKYGIES